MEKPERVFTYLVTSVCDYTAGILTIKRVTEVYREPFKRYNRSVYEYLMRRTHHYRDLENNWEYDKGLYGKSGGVFRRIEKGRCIEYRHSVATPEDLLSLPYTEMQMEEDFINAADAAGFSVSFLSDGSAKVNGKCFAREGRNPFCYIHVVANYCCDKMREDSRNHRSIDKSLSEFWSALDPNVEIPVFEDPPVEFSNIAMTTFAVSAMIALRDLK